jgi:hypothetical protein
MLIILATWKAEFKRIVVCGHLVREIMRPPSHPRAGHAGACLSSKLHGRLKIGGSWSRPPWAKSETLSPKAKMDKGMAQVVAHLPIKCKALNSNSSTAKRKKKKKKG